ARKRASSLASGTAAPSPARRTYVLPKRDSCMHASSGESSGASFERASSARSSRRPRRRSQRRMRFSTRAATLAISAWGSPSFVDTRLRRAEASVVALDLRGGQVAERRVQAPAVVEHLDVV